MNERVRQEWSSDQVSTCLDFVLFDPHLYAPFGYLTSAVLHTNLSAFFGHSFCNNSGQAARILTCQTGSSCIYQTSWGCCVNGSVFICLLTSQWIIRWSCKTSWKLHFGKLNFLLSNKAYLGGQKYHGFHSIHSMGQIPFMLVKVLKKKKILSWRRSILYIIRGWRHVQYILTESNYYNLYFPQNELSTVPSPWQQDSWYGKMKSFNCSQIQSMEEQFSKIKCLQLKQAANCDVAVSLPALFPSPNLSNFFCASPKTTSSVQTFPADALILPFPLATFLMWYFEVWIKGGKLKAAWTSEQRLNAAVCWLSHILTTHAACLSNIGIFFWVDFSFYQI